MAVGKNCFNCRTETEALAQAASIVQASDHDCKQVVFLSDALSVLQTYQNHKLPNLTKALQQVAATKRAVLPWIPAHCGISGNKQANILAEEGARGEQHNNHVSFSKRFSSERSRCHGQRGMTVTCCPDRDEKTLTPLCSSSDKYWNTKETVTPLPPLLPPSLPPSLPHLLLLRSPLTLSGLTCCGSLSFVLR